MYFAQCALGLSFFSSPTVAWMLNAPTIKGRGSMLMASRVVPDRRTFFRAASFGLTSLALGAHSSATAMSPFISDYVKGDLLFEPIVSQMVAEVDAMLMCNLIFVQS